MLDGHCSVLSDRLGLMFLDESGSLFVSMLLELFLVKLHMDPMVYSRKLLLIKSWEAKMNQASDLARKGFQTSR